MGISRIIKIVHWLSETKVAQLVVDYTNDLFFEKLTSSLDIS